VDAAADAVARFEHGDTPAGTGQFTRGSEPRCAGADDDGVVPQDGYS